AWLWAKAASGAVKAAATATELMPRKCRSFIFGFPSCRAALWSVKGEKSLLAGHHGGATAIDEKLGSHNEIRIVGHQEQHGARQIDGFAWPVAEIHHFAVRVEF